MRNISLLTLLGLGLIVAPFAHAQAGGQVPPGYGNQGYGNPGYQDPNYANPNYPDPGYPQQYDARPGYGDYGYEYPGPPPACPYGYFPYYP